MVTASPFIPSLGSVTQTPIITAAIAINHDLTGQTFIALFHQSLQFEELETCLLCPQQMRDVGIIVNDMPLLHLTPEQHTPLSHSIHVPEYNLHISLVLNGVMSGFNARKPTQYEIKHPEEYPQINMMQRNPPWDPYDESFTNDEASL